MQLVCFAENSFFSSAQFYIASGFAFYQNCLTQVQQPVPYAWQIQDGGQLSKNVAFVSVIATDSAVNLKGIWPRRAPAVHAAGGLGAFYLFIYF